MSYIYKAAQLITSTTLLSSQTNKFLAVTTLFSRYWKLSVWGTTSILTRSLDLELGVLQICDLNVLLAFIDTPASL